MSPVNGHANDSASIPTTAVQQIAPPASDSNIPTALTPNAARIKKLIADVTDQAWKSHSRFPHLQTSGDCGVHDLLPGVLANYEMTQRSNPALSKPVNRKSLPRLPN
jgi:hypothetical protein